MRSESQERIQLSHGKVSLNPANIQRTLSPTIPWHSVKRDSEEGGGTATERQFYLVLNLITTFIVNVLGWPWPAVRHLPSHFCTPPPQQGKGRKSDGKIHVVIKTGRSLITYSHDLKQTLGKTNLMYCQLRTAGWWETKKLLKTFSHPSSPGERRKRGENKAWLQSFSHDSSTSSPKIQWHRGVGNGGCYQSVTLHLCCSFLLTIFLYSTMVSPRAAGKPLL